MTVRGVFGKVMRVGRATVFALGAAVVLAVVLGAATAALAAVPGDPLRLGQVNAINALTQLVGEKSGPMLRIDNNGTGYALQLLVESRKPPLVVSADAGKATNLNADELDGKDASAFLASEIYTVSVTSNSIQPGFGSGATAYCDAGDVAVSGGYRDINANLKIYLEQRVDERFDAETGQTNPSGWQVVGSLPLEAGADGLLEVQAYCADFPPMHGSSGS